MELVKKHAVTGVMFVIILLLLFGGSDNCKISNVTDDADMSAASMLSLEDKVEEVAEQTEENIESGQETQEIEELAPASQAHEEEYYLVIKVIDGDTVSIDKDGGKITLRLIGLDTPETVHPSKPVECFGREASDKAKAMLSGKQVRIETDPSQGTYDKYGRTLAYVHLEDGTHFNKYMIEEGYGYEYTYDLPYKYQAEFKQAQQEAQASKRGLWAPDVCDETAEEPNVSPAEPENTDITPEHSANAGEYICSYNAYNCGDFSTHLEAQTAYDACGGVSNDIHRLDKDKDGEACESLP